MIEIRRDLVGVPSGDSKWQRLIAALSTMPIGVRKMPRVANCKTDIEYSGPYAQEIKSFAAGESWTKEKTISFQSIVQFLKKSCYRYFNSSVNTIGLQRKGQSAIYHVPLRQAGALAAYAGKYAHIICVARTDDYSGRVFAVSEVSEIGQLVRGGRLKK
jgi:hypothetical protein